MDKLNMVIMMYHKNNNVKTCELVYVNPKNRTMSNAE